MGLTPMFVDSQRLHREVPVFLAVCVGTPAISNVGWSPRPSMPAADALRACPGYPHLRTDRELALLQCLQALPEDTWRLWTIVGSFALRLYDGCDVGYGCNDVDFVLRDAVFGLASVRDDATAWLEQVWRRWPSMQVVRTPLILTMRLRLHECADDDVEMIKLQCFPLSVHASMVAKHFDFPMCGLSWNPVDGFRHITPRIRDLVRRRLLLPCSCPAPRPDVRRRKRRKVWRDRRFYRSEGRLQKYQARRFSLCPNHDWQCRPKRIEDAKTQSFGSHPCCARKVHSRTHEVCPFVPSLLLLSGRCVLYSPFREPLDACTRCRDRAERTGCMFVRDWCMEAPRDRLVLLTPHICHFALQLREAREAYARCVVRATGTYRILVEHESQVNEEYTVEHGSLFRWRHQLNPVVALLSKPISFHYGVWSRTDVEQWFAKVGLMPSFWSWTKSIMLLPPETFQLPKLGVLAFAFLEAQRQNQRLFTNTLRSILTTVWHCPQHLVQYFCDEFLPECGWHFEVTKRDWDFVFAPVHVLVARQ